jgi:putative Ig domain-containing protein
MLGGRPGLLPAGMKLNARTGQLSGTPRKAGTYRLRLQVTDKLGVHSAAGFVLKVNA